MPTVATSHADLLSALRSPAGVRAPVDPGLAGGLRAWLEDAATGGGSVRRPIVLGCDRLDDTAGAALLQALVAAVFRLTVTVGPPDDPFAAALSALRVDEDGSGVAESIRAIGAGDRAALRVELGARAKAIGRQWRRVPAAWLPRTGDRLVVPLAGGRIVLTGDADLALGAPSEGRASVCLVDVAAGRPRRARCAERRGRLALLETVRSGAPPFRVATYYPAVGRLEVDEVTGELLAAAVTRACGAIGRDVGGPR